jgi:hypothetical protein
MASDAKTASKASPAEETAEEPVEDDEPAVEEAPVEPDPPDVADLVRDVIGTDHGAPPHRPSRAPRSSWHKVRP